jgi:integrase
MSKKQISPFRRHPTKNRGITYRVSASGRRTYHVSHKGSYVAAPSQEAAVALQAELRLKAAKGETTITPSKIIFAEIAERYWEAKSPRFRESTAGEYRRSLDNIHIPRFGTRKAASLTVDDIAALIRDLHAQKLKITAIRAFMIPLRGVMKYAARNHLIPSDPCTLLTEDDWPHSNEDEDEDEPMHVWSDAEMQALVAAAEYRARQPGSRYDYTPLIRVGLATGLRIAELLGLQWQDINWEKDGDKYRGELQVRRQWLRSGKYVNYLKTKSSRRPLPLPDDLVRYLIAYKLRSEFSKDEDPVFASKTGKPLGHRNVTGRGFEPAAEHAGIEGVSFHDMRHAFASRCIARGMDAVRLAKRLGHKDATITLRVYAHLYDQLKSDEEDREAMAWTM